MSQDFLITKEKLSFAGLHDVHSANLDVTPALSRFNRLNGNLTGTSIASVTVSESAINRFFNDKGYRLSVERNRTGQPSERFLPFVSDKNQQLFVDSVFNALFTVAKQHFPQMTGTVALFDEKLPIVHVFANPTSNNPLDLARSLHKPHNQEEDKSDENSNKKQSGNQQQEQLTQQHLRQAIAQQQAAEKEEEKKRKERQKRERERRQRRRHEPDLEP